MQQLSMLVTFVALQLASGAPDQQLLDLLGLSRDDNRLTKIANGTYSLKPAMSVIFSSHELLPIENESFASSSETNVYTHLFVHTSGKGATMMLVEAVDGDLSRGYTKRLLFRRRLPTLEELKKSATKRQLAQLLGMDSKADMLGADFNSGLFSQGSNGELSAVLIEARFSRAASREYSRIEAMIVKQGPFAPAAQSRVSSKQPHALLSRLAEVPAKVHDFVVAYLQEKEATEYTQKLERMRVTFDFAAARELFACSRGDDQLAEICEHILNEIYCPALTQNAGRIEWKPTARSDALSCVRDELHSATTVRKLRHLLKLFLFASEINEISISGDDNDSNIRLSKRNTGDGIAFMDDSGPAPESSLSTLIARAAEFCSRHIERGMK